MRLHLLMLVSAGCGLPVVCAGQVTSMASEILTPESRVWRPILEVVVSRVAGDIVRAANAPTEEAWIVTLPDSTPSWLRLRDHFMRMLRARPVSAEDESFRELYVGPLRITGDTARVELRTSFTRKCPGSTWVTGSGTNEDILLARFPTFGWGARASSASVLVGDRVPCAWRPPSKPIM
jgi:hypothetical protein